MWGAGNQDFPICVPAPEISLKSTVRYPLFYREMLLRLNLFPAHPPVFGSCIAPLVWNVLISSLHLLKSTCPSRPPPTWSFPDPSSLRWHQAALKSQLYCFDHIAAKLNLHCLNIVTFKTWLRSWIAILLIDMTRMPTPWEWGQCLIFFGSPQYMHSFSSWCSGCI